MAFRDFIILLLFSIINVQIMHAFRFTLNPLAAYPYYLISFYFMPLFLFIIRCYSCSLRKITFLEMKIF